MPRHNIKKLDDGRAMLNVGCGTRMHWGWNNVDFSPYARLRRHRALVAMLDRAGFLSDLRRQRLSQVDPDIVAWNVARGIPFPDASFDVVYHSHVLEHFPRGRGVESFLAECRRVLKPGGMLRVVVPDLEQIVAMYEAAFERVTNDGNDPASSKAYDDALFELFEQMTRDEIVGANQQRPLAGVIERMIRGDASRVGDRHRWAYDRFSLGRLLRAADFEQPQQRDAASSAIEGWREFNIDTEPDGRPYKELSLYMEAVRA